jgi:hypothetical protein
MNSDAQATTRIPENTLQEFYSWVLSSRTNTKSSLPTVDDRKRLAAVLAPALVKLISDVTLAEQRCFDSVKGTTDKPYFFESDVFTGNWGAGDEVTYGEVVPKNGRVIVNVTHISVNSLVAKADRNRVEVWTNKVDLRANGDEWLIHDLRYRDGSTLVSRFSEYLARSREWCR